MGEGSVIRMMFLMLVALVAVLIVFGTLMGCAQTSAPLTQVDPYVWRSGQPQTFTDWQAIKAKGVTDVIKLDFEGEGSDAMGESMGLRIHALNIEPRGDQDVFDDLLNTFRHPDPIMVGLIDAELATAGPGKVYLVHCRWGHDRTGWVTGRYLVMRRGWTKSQAHAWMVKNGYHVTLHGLEDSWQDWQP